MTDLNNLRFSEEHEWVDASAGTIVRIGITDHAVEQLGDVVFVELPDVDAVVAAGDAVGEIESTKSVSEIFAPVSGTVVEVNDAVVDDPSLVSSSPFDEGWLIKIETDEGAVDALLDRAAYIAITEG